MGHESRNVKTADVSPALIQRLAEGTPWGGDDDWARAASHVALRILALDRVVAESGRGDRAFDDWRVDRPPSG